MVKSDRNSVRRIILLWLAWCVILWGYQAAVTARYQVQYPDHVLFWTAANTDPQRWSQRPYLSEPFLNAQVGWDSEFYLSIATQGYDDPQARTVPPPINAQPPLDRPLPLNYAFFPVYPYLIRGVSLPLRYAGLNPIATATLAGVVISGLSTLVGMLMLYTWIQQAFDSETAWRSVFYLICFPTSFFMGQVYTEGLFLALSWGCLVCGQRQQWMRAGLLASIAAMTRAVGVALLIPMLLDWWQADRRSPISELASTPCNQSAQPKPSGQIGRELLALLSPLIVHLIWRSSTWGAAFQQVQSSFFNCRLMNLPAAGQAWSSAIASLGGQNTAAIVHSAIELAAVTFGFISCLLLLRRYPGIALYSLFILAVSTSCGTAWSISRYLLTIPTVFIILGQIGRSELFDRVWSMFSLMLLAMLTALFSFNLWAG
ncbi:MAG: hypothetical protein MUF72_08185 [Elainella sp. Prado103]|nr:hypothetical protein [Elainella sp. Prado103]